MEKNEASLFLRVHVSTCMWACNILLMTFKSYLQDVRPFLQF